MCAKDPGMGGSKITKKLKICQELTSSQLQSMWLIIVAKTHVQSLQIFEVPLVVMLNYAP